MSIRHSKTSEKADGSDESLVRPSDWNADHVVDVGSTGVLYVASGVLTTTATVSTAGTVSSGQLTVFTNSTTISGYTTSGYVKLTTTGIVATSSTIPVADVPNARKIGVYNEFLHPNLFLTAGYTNPPSVGQATPDTAGGAASLRRLQYQKDTANIIYSGVTWVPPKSWNAATSLTISVYGFKTTAGTGTKTQVKARAIAFGNGDAFSTTFTASATNINFTIGSGSSNTIFTASSVVTIDNTPAKGDAVFIQIARDSTTGNSANDDYDNTFGVAGINISYTVDAQDDS